MATVVEMKLVIVVVDRFVERALGGAIEVVDQLPLTAMLKIDKRVLQDRLAQER